VRGQEGGSYVKTPSHLGEECEGNDHISSNLQLKPNGNGKGLVVEQPTTLNECRYGKYG
jgi:hypothetical protein